MLSASPCQLYCAMCSIEVDAHGALAMTVSQPSDSPPGPCRIMPCVRVRCLSRANLPDPIRGAGVGFGLRATSFAGARFPRDRLPWPQRASLRSDGSSRRRDHGQRDVGPMTARSDSVRSHGKRIRDSGRRLATRHHGSVLVCSCVIDAIRGFAMRRRCPDFSHGDRVMRGLKSEFF